MLARRERQNGNHLWPHSQWLLTPHPQNVTSCTVVWFGFLAFFFQRVCSKVACNESLLCSAAFRYCPDERAGKGHMADNPLLFSSKHQGSMLNPAKAMALMPDSPSTPQQPPWSGQGTAPGVLSPACEMKLVILLSEVDWDCMFCDKCLEFEM